MKRSASRDISFFSDGFEDCGYYVSEEERSLSPRPKRDYTRKTSEWWDLSIFAELIYSNDRLDEDLRQFKNFIPY